MEAKGATTKIPFGMYDCMVDSDVCKKVIFVMKNCAFGRWFHYFCQESANAMAFGGTLLPSPLISATVHWNLQCDLTTLTRAAWEGSDNYCVTQHVQTCRDLLKQCW